MTVSIQNYSGFSAWITPGFCSIDNLVPALVDAEFTEHDRLRDVVVLLREVGPAALIPGPGSNAAPSLDTSLISLRELLSTSVNLGWSASATVLLTGIPAKCPKFLRLPRC